MKNEHHAQSLSFPDEEAALVAEAYEGATTILEYGSGSSTLFASNLSGKCIFSVESSGEWVARLRTSLEKAKTSTVCLYHVDIGPVGDWGHPVDATHWFKFHEYPLRIWYEPEFKAPDVILIDGRFRVACFLISLLHVTKPTLVLFDDYADRDRYHVVEEFAPLERKVGRMAVFNIAPRNFTKAESLRMITIIFRSCSLNQLTQNASITHLEAENKRLAKQLDSYLQKPMRTALRRQLKVARQAIRTLLTNS